MKLLSELYPVPTIDSWIESIYLRPGMLYTTAGYTIYKHVYSNKENRYACSAQHGLSPSYNRHCPVIFKGYSTVSDEEYEVVRKKFPNVVPHKI